MLALGFPNLCSNGLPVVFLLEIAYGIHDAEMHTGDGNKQQLYKGKACITSQAKRWTSLPSALGTALAKSKEASLAEFCNFTNGP